MRFRVKNDFGSIFTGKVGKLYATDSSNGSVTLTMPCGTVTSFLEKNLEYIPPDELPESFYVKARPYHSKATFNTPEKVWVKVGYGEGMSVALVNRSDLLLDAK